MTRVSNDVGRRDPSSRLGDWLFSFIVWGAVLLTSWSWLDLRWSSSPRVFWVSVDGSDWSFGTDARPFRTVQWAVQRLRPGDEVRVRPGVYAERVHLRRGGVAGKPVRLVAEVPGTVTLSGAASAEDVALWRWTDRGDGLFETTPGWSVYRLAVDDATLYRVPWGGVDALRKLAARPQALGAFCMDGDRLWIALPGGADPRHANLRTHRDVPPPREWGDFRSANLWIEADHIDVHGLRFEFGIGANVLIWDGEGVLVEDCAFTEATFGILSASNSNRLTVRRCLYHNYPQQHWRASGWLNWSEVYTAYASSTLVGASGDEIVVSECVAAHTGDAVRLNGVPDQGADRVVVRRNWFVTGTDDTLEAESSGAGVTFENNLVLNAFVTLGLAPVHDGPLQARRNLWLNPQLRTNGAAFKLLGNRRDRGVDVTRRVSVNENLLFGKWLAWQGRCRYEDCQIRDNIFFVEQLQEQPFADGIMTSGNLFEAVDSDALQGKTLADFLPRLREQARGHWGEGVADEVFAILDERPGPSWWKHQAHPATADLADLGRLPIEVK